MGYTEQKRPRSKTRDIKADLKKGRPSTRELGEISTVERLGPML